MTPGLGGQPGKMHPVKSGDQREWRSATPCPILLAQSIGLRLVSDPGDREKLSKILGADCPA
jgi:hypothetical protein